MILLNIISHKYIYDSLYITKIKLSPFQTVSKIFLSETSPAQISRLHFLLSAKSHAQNIVFSKKTVVMEVLFEVWKKAQ